MRVDLHPVYRVFINLESLYNVDLTVRGYYQVRLIPKPSNDFSSVDISCMEKLASSTDSSILSSSIQNGVGTSRTVELTYVEEVLEIGDVFSIKVQLGPQTDLTKVHRLHLDVELWSMDRHRPPRHDLFELECRMNLEIDMNPCRLTAIARTVSFDYQAPSILSLAVYSSLLTIMPRRRKPPPDPPLSSRLREYHGSMCSTLLRAITSMELFISRNAHLLPVTVNMAPIDSSLEEASLISRLESSDRPWATLEASAVQLSNRLDVLYNQLIELFGNSKALFDVLHASFHDWRLKLLGEAFFFEEKELGELKRSQPTTTNELYSLVLKSKYLSRLSRCPVFCAATDSPAENCPIVFEECFGSAPSTSIGIRTETVNSRESVSDRARAGKVDASLLSRKGGQSKSFRLLKLRRKSAEALAGNRLVIPRGSVDATTTGCKNSESAEETTAADLSQTVDAASAPDLLSSIAPTFSAPVPILNSMTSLVPLSIEDDEIDRLVQFVRERETVKGKLRTQAGYEGHLYSELASYPARPPLLPPRNDEKGKRLVRSRESAHLVVLVHGLEGCADDLLPYKNALRTSNPDANHIFLMSSANQCETWTDFELMSRNLLREVGEYVEESQEKIERISFIAHSMGGVIVRAALGCAESAWMHPLLFTLLTINTPHLGLTYAGRGLNWGLQVVQWWKRSRSMEQLSLRDALSFQDSFLFRLSKNGAFGRFKNILLIGAPHDLYVPSHSALLEPCKMSMKDPSALGTAYRDMLSSIYDDICSSNERERTVVRYSTFHSCTTNRSTRLTGRAAHVAAVEDDTFIEKLFSVSALRYFV